MHALRLVPNHMYQAFRFGILVSPEVLHRARLVNADEHLGCGLQSFVAGSVNCMHGINARTGGHARIVV